MTTAGVIGETKVLLLFVEPGARGEVGISGGTRENGVGVSQGCTS